MKIQMNKKKKQDRLILGSGSRHTGYVSIVLFDQLVVGRVETLVDQILSRLNKSVPFGQISVISFLVQILILIAQVVNGLLIILMLLLISIGHFVIKFLLQVLVVVDEKIFFIFLFPQGFFLFLKLFAQTDHLIFHFLVV